MKLAEALEKFTTFLGRSRPVLQVASQRVKTP